MTESTIRRRYITVKGRRVDYTYDTRTRTVTVPGVIPWKAECWASAPDEVRSVIRGDGG